jgi:osmoprotectant transport system permease protein
MKSSRQMSLFRSIMVALVWLTFQPNFAAAYAPPIKVGSKSFTESVILGEIVTQLARSGNAAAEHRSELGGTQILWKALLAGDIDVYPEYSGTITQEILAGQPIRGIESIEVALAKFGVKISRRLGLNNTYALGMKADRAKKLGIKSISDLAKHADVGSTKFGLSDEFLERQDGWPGLQKRYALPEKTVRGLDHNLAYRGLEQGSIDVTDLFTTDPEILYYNLTPLDDDKGYFPAYYAVLLYRSDLADREPGALSQILKLEDRVSSETMVELNARSKLDRVAEPQIAADFITRQLGIDVPLPQSGSGVAWQRILARLVQHTGEHLFLVLISLSAAVLVAVPLGIAATRSRVLGKAILSVVGVIQTLPSLAVLVFMIPICGLGAGSALVALFLYSLLPILRGTYTGLKEIPGHLKESALVLGLPAWARLRLVELPLAMPSILSGIKTAAVINVGTATIGALIGAGGYGQPILTGIRLDNMSLILQGAVPAAAMAVLVQFGFDLAERWIIPAGLRAA